MRRKSTAKGVLFIACKNQMLYFHNTSNYTQK